MVQEADLRIVEKFKGKLIKRFQNAKVILFGSRARGNFTEESDFDLIIVSDAFKDKDVIKRGSLMYEDWDYNFAVDFICYTPEEFKEKKSRISIVSEAIKTGVVIK